MISLRIDQSLRNMNDPRNTGDEFGLFFRFDDGKGINNTAGFRPKSKAGHPTKIESCAFCVLVTTFQEPQWPDKLDPETGLFTYFGDKRSEGDLHQTVVGGNRFLRSIFEKMHLGLRDAIPPVLVFRKYKGDDGMYMRFLGLAAPGAQGVSSFDDLVAVWRVRGESRFQNYRATFTVLRSGEVSKQWLADLVSGTAPSSSAACPPEWRHWVTTGIYQPLLCSRRAEPRPIIDQLPRSGAERELLEMVLGAFSDREFEFAAAEIVRLMDPGFADFDVTRGVRDGGRDAVGNYKIGHPDHQIQLEAVLEAKFWKKGQDVGVKPMSRLISRIRHRFIGVFVTTSCFNKQVQQELIEDGHPIILISGGDIARILIANELDSITKFDGWVQTIRARASGLQSGKTLLPEIGSGKTGST